jgi:transcriptional regulator with XRE-family HTH domain
MDQIKIGEYISKKRKMKKLTQFDLAEKLGITDRAISKWENGVCMPDAGTIPELCKILNISINDLFSGEDVDMKNFEKQAEENLLALKKNEEEMNKKLFLSVHIIGIVSTFFFLAFTFLLTITMEESKWFILFFLVGALFYIASMFVALNLDKTAGYQECKNCHHKFKPTFKEIFLAPHMGYTRHLKCHKCGKKTWCKKVMK